MRTENEKNHIKHAQLSASYSKRLQQAGRSSLADPEKSSSYGLPEFLNKEENKAMFQTQKIIFTPMDNRTTAGPLSTQDYAHFARGGFSWSTPWMAGMYALCLQIDPTLTAEQFLETAYASGDNMKLIQLGIETDSSCVLINPKQLIKEIEKAAKHGCCSNLLFNPEKALFSYILTS